MWFLNGGGLGACGCGRWGPVMLTVAKVTGRQAQGYADYLEGKTTTELGDYYLKDGERVEAPGRWVSGAERLGCEPAGRRRALRS